MTNKEIRAIFIEKTVIPFMYMIVCGIIFMPLAKSGGRIDLGVLFVCTSYVFGVIAIIKKLNINRSMRITIRLISIPIVLFGGFAIGIGIYVYAIAVALYYIPITIGNLIMKDKIVPEQGYTQSSNQITSEFETPVLFDFTNSMSDEGQLQIMREMQRARENSKKK